MDEIRVIDYAQTPSVQKERWAICTPNGDVMSAGSFLTVETRFGNEWVKTLMVGGVGTEPEYRRGGYVRQMLEKSLREARERGWTVALLHPFSFSYYRKFGYERVADHLIVDMPLSKLDFVPRCAEFERLRTETQLQEVLDVYAAFAQDRLLLTRRLDGEYYPLDGALNTGIVYLHRDEAGKADACIKLRLNKEVDVNHYAHGVLTISELIYTSKAALWAALGFMRMFDGEADSLHFDNIAPTPEVDWTLRHYTHNYYRLLPDIMARILDPQALLKAHRYPQAAGCFTLRVLDEAHVAEGAWRVRYAGGRAQIEPLDDETVCDVTADVRPLAALLYGALDIDVHSIAYLDGVTVNGSAEDFLRAFPRRACGVFEHF